MANKKARINDKDGGTVGSLQTVRVPIFSDSDIYDAFPQPLTGSTGGFATNVIFEEIETDQIGAKKYRARKRAGLVRNIQPTSSRVGKGVYYWNSKVYSVWSSRLYSGTTLIYDGLDTTTTSVSFSNTHPDAVTQYLLVNDGTQLLLIDTSDNVLVMNNISIFSSSVAGTTTITTNAAHKLVTGNRVIIRNHTGSTPSLNDTIYTVTVTGVFTFTIPVAVAVGGTGGTIGVFPVNVGDTQFLDGYNFVGTTAGRVYNCNYNDPTTWTTTSYITCQMEHDNLIGLGRQNNYIVALKEQTVQFFYDKGDSIVGQTPLSNVEQSMQQVGCSSRVSISSTSNTMFWVGNSKNGGMAVYSLEGSSKAVEIQNSFVGRNLTYNFEVASGSSTGCYGSLISLNGHTIYLLCLAGNSVVGYDVDSKTWVSFENADSGVSPTFPVFWTQGDGPTKTHYGQPVNSDFIYIFNPVLGTDGSTNMTVRIRFAKLELDTTKRKFFERVEVVGTRWGTSGTLTLYYNDSDDLDPINSPISSRSWTVSATPTNNRFWSRSWGNGRRRNWGLTHVSSTAGTLYENLEMDVRISEY